MSRRKRALDSSTSEESRDDMKRRALFDDIMDAVKAKLMPKILSLIEDTVQEVVLPAAENQSNTLNSRFSSDCIEARHAKNLQLQFRTRIRKPIFTGRKLAGEGGAAIQIVLMDANTGHVVTDGPESSVMLDIVMLDGDFKKKDNDNWSQEEFEKYLLKEREGRKPLLTGELQLMLKQGTCVLDNISITDNSRWTRSGKFIIGVRVASGSCERIRIREAITEALTIKENRGELYKKHYPPKSEDDVWRLEMIAKGGPSHKALNSSGIYTVQDLLQLLARDEKRLRSIFDNKMSETKWSALIKHAKTCLANGKLYAFSIENMWKKALVFNNLGQLTGLIADAVCYSTTEFSDDQKIFADSWLNITYENWHLVTEITGEDSLCLILSGNSISSQAVASGSHHQYSNVSDNHLTMPSIPISVIPSEVPSDITGTAAGHGTDIQSVSLSCSTQKLQAHSGNQTELLVSENVQLSALCQSYSPSSQVLHATHSYPIDNLEMLLSCQEDYLQDNLPEDTEDGGKDHASLAKGNYEFRWRTFYLMVFCSRAFAKARNC